MKLRVDYHWLRLGERADLWCSVFADAQADYGFAELTVRY